MYETILVPVEMGQIDRAGAMLSAACHLLTTGGKTTYLAVLPETPGHVAADLPRNPDENPAEEANAALSKVINATGVASHRHSDRPRGAEILAVAERTGAEAIIIGSHKPGPEDYMLCSTAGRVVRHAACHVLVQRQAGSGFFIGGCSDAACAWTPSVKAQPDSSAILAFLPHDSRLFALPVAFLVGFALVVLFLAASNTQVEFCNPAIVEVDRQGDQSCTLLLGGSDQAGHFALVE